MTKIMIPFTTNDHKKVECLTYTLHDHFLAEQWKQLVTKSQYLFNANYNATEIYGIDSYDDLLIKLRYAFIVVKKFFPELWKESFFDEIRNPDFEINQRNLNLSHAFFEKATALARENHFIMNRVFNELHLLNHSVHKLEHTLSNPNGLYVNASMENSLFKNISSESNSLFSLDMKWGQLCLGYCHIGEDIMDSFRKNHALPPVPHTKMSGDFVMDFDEDAKFGETDKLKSWVKEKYGQNTEIKDLPLGRIPLAQIESGFSKDQVKDFFSRYTLINKQIRFA